MDLETIKNTIESWPKHHQLEILKIIKNNESSTINENKSGIYINISFLSEKTMNEIKRYIEYVQDQEKILTPLESQKDGFKNTFFMEKEHKDEMLYNYST
jgi:predicted component of viral defense system (DUF524 family)